MVGWGSWKSDGLLSTLGPLMRINRVAINAPRYARPSEQWGRLPDNPQSLVRVSICASHQLAREDRRVVPPHALKEIRWLASTLASQGMFVLTIHPRFR